MTQHLIRTKLDSARVQRTTSNDLIIRVTAVLMSDGVLLEKTDLILDLYHAKPLTGHAWLHGTK